MLRFATAILAFLVLVAPAWPQDQGPVMGSSATDQQDAAQRAPQQFLVIGDSLGGGLGAGITRLRPESDVTLRFVEESGIARPEVYDWSASLPKILDGKQYDDIIVLLGANDRQMIKSGALRLNFNSPEWAAAYKAQLDRILGVLKSSGARVYWVSLPPMADKDFEAAMQVIAALQRERVAAHGMSFIDVHKDFLAADGSYTDSGPDDTGVVRKLRSSDGITFFKQGNNRLAQLVLAAIKSGAPPVVAKVETPEPEAAAEPREPAVVLPTFGQLDADGNAVLVTPSEVLVAMASGSSEDFVLGSGSHKDLIAVVPPGSAAEKLFRLGVADVPPAGRIDDFNVPPQAQP